MNFKEYNKVSNLNYNDYCKYLQDKYGIPKKAYFTKGFSKNNISRTKEGLFVHHMKEDTAIMLSTVEIAKKNPYEFQLPENLVYCDYLEHLFLHILICENPNPDHNKLEAVGIGGVENFIIPQMNDFYSGYPIKLPWMQNCFNKVKDDYDVYKILVKRFKNHCFNYPLYNEKLIYSSFNESFGSWSVKNNKKVINDLKLL